MRGINRLTVGKVRSESRPGVYGDGNGLWLNIAKGGSKSWLFRYMVRGRAHEMGLGSTSMVTLADAREAAREARRTLHDGIDPLARKRGETARRVAETAAVVTFKQAADRFMQTNRAGWSASHANQWATNMRDYAYPILADVPVGAIETAHVTKVLLPIWTAIPPTAERLRQRLESVLDYSKALGWRTGENPAAWRGHLQNVLPKPVKVRAIVHHAALPWREVGAFMVDLADQGGMAALALRFVVLTAARSTEVLKARWSEIDMKQALWIIPGSRMKAGAEHRVPLSDSAMTILTELADLRSDGDSLVFPGRKPGAPLDEKSMRFVLERMKRPDITPHGMRSSFRTWCADHAVPDDIAEQALAHAKGKVESAYQRSSMLDRRRTLMRQWAEHCARPAMPESADVIALRR